MQTRGVARVLVLGAGVIGLSCAVRLLEQGHRVDVVARDLPLETTSAVAAALWYPHQVFSRRTSDAAERATHWAAATYAELARLADDEGSGVVLRTGTEVFVDGAETFWWADAVPHLARATEIPAGYRAGWTFEAPVAEMPVYLGWLTDRVEALGGTITRMALGALPDRTEVVVNAAGLGGRLFGSDPSVLPVRGQVVHVEQVGLDQWWLDSAGPTYVVPRSTDIVVGGTDDEGVWDRHPDQVVAAEILARARALVPELKGAAVLGHRVGLRPVRPTVRLEAVTTSAGRRVVHCYGHGGAGLTLSWGCADEVAAFVAG